MLETITPAGAVAAARWELAAELTDDLRGADAGSADQEEGRHRGAGVRDQPDRAVRGGSGRRRRSDRRRPRCVPLPQPGSLRRLQRHRPDRGLLRGPENLAAVPARQPPPQPRHPHGRGHPDPPPAQPGPGGAPDLPDCGSL